MRIVIPDLDIRIKNYNQTGDADEFMKSLSLVNIRNKYGLVDKIKFIFLGDHGHKWMYNGESFKGFVESTSLFEGYILQAGESKLPFEFKTHINLRERENDSAYIEFRKL